MLNSYIENPTLIRVFSEVDSMLFMRGSVMNTCLLNELESDLGALNLPSFAQLLLSIISVMNSCLSFCLCR